MKNKILTYKERLAQKGIECFISPKQESLKRAVKKQFNPSYSWNGNKKK